jgi:hypothetical protein
MTDKRTRLPPADEAPTYSHLQVEAALCIWEEIIERTAKRRDSEHAALIAYRKNCGTGALRHESITLAAYCLAVYDLLPEHARDGYPYDWEIIPAILDTIDWSIGPQALLAPAVAAAVVTRADIQHAALTAAQLL